MRLVNDVVCTVSAGLVAGRAQRAPLKFLPVSAKRLRQTTGQDEGRPGSPDSKCSGETCDIRGYAGLSFRRQTENNHLLCSVPDPDRYSHFAVSCLALASPAPHAALPLFSFQRADEDLTPRHQSRKSRSCGGLSLQRTKSRDMATACVKRNRCVNAVRWRSNLTGRYRCSTICAVFIAARQTATDQR